MTIEIALVFSILIISVVLLISEIIPMEVTALLTLGAVALTGLVPPADALSGFSNPAVVTIWAVFIVSGGLTRTGVANVIGNFVLRLAGTRESSMIIVIMTTAGIMSAIMNNVAVAALMLPVVMDIAQHTRRHPGRLLMPLAYGCLLGGLTTQIGTPPNILVTEALQQEGLVPFRFFDFTPVGVIIMVVGTLFMAYVGRHLLPNESGQEQGRAGKGQPWLGQYELVDKLFYVTLPSNTPALYRSLARIRLGSILGWNVIAIQRRKETIISPGPDFLLEAGDQLIVDGDEEGLLQLHHWKEQLAETGHADFIEVYGETVELAELTIGEGSPFIGNSLNNMAFRQEYGLNVLAVKREGRTVRRGLADLLIQENDLLLLAGEGEKITRFHSLEDVGLLRQASTSTLRDEYALPHRFQVQEVRENSSLTGQTMKESRLADTMGCQVFGILRGDALLMPEPGFIFEVGDQLLTTANEELRDILTGLKEVTITPYKGGDLANMIKEPYGLAEVILSPQTSLEGKTLRQLNFREKFGLNVLALCRQSKSLSTSLRDIELQFGDSFLLLGTVHKLRLLAQESDFVVLSKEVQEPLEHEKRKYALAILFFVLAPVILGWVPIYIAMVIGAACMVLFRCLTMEEAYRQIEWKAVFLIGGMLPLGAALDKTGAAKLIAEGVVAVVGPFGPVGIMFGLIAMTFMFTCFVPTAALVVLMAPIVFNTSASMGLSPHGLLMAVAMAASASLMTPVAHPANTLVMGPGGYQFKDYLKIGGLLTLVIFVVLMVVLPFFWPLKP